MTHQYLDHMQELEQSKELSSEYVIILKEEWQTAKTFVEKYMKDTYEIDAFEHPWNIKDIPAKSPSDFEKTILGVKYDSGKPRFDLIPADALEEVAKVYAVGADQYGDRNWELGMTYGRLFRAMMSHAWAWWRGERDDSKNKLHHLTSVVFNALALLHYELNKEKYSKWDNRK